MQWITSVIPALTFLLLVLTAVGYSVDQPQDASGSGEESEKCVVPAYAPQQPVSTTEKEALAKMRCHLACIESDSLGVIKSY